MILPQETEQRTYKDRICAQQMPVFFVAAFFSLTSPAFFVILIL